MWDTILGFIKDWGSMTPSRKLSTLLMVLLFCAFLAVSYLYKQSEKRYREVELSRIDEILNCKEDSRILQQELSQLQAEFRRYLISEKQFKLQLRDSLK